MVIRSVGAQKVLRRHSGGYERGAACHAEERSERTSSGLRACDSL